MQLNKQPLLISITGGICTGKSTISNLLRLSDYTVYSADKIAHNAYNNPTILKELIALFGENVTTNGSLDRTKIGELVFKDKQLLTKLESILHPFILKEMQRLYSEFKGEYCFFEVPLLYEAKLSECFDCNIVVYSTRSFQLERLTILREITQRQAENILKSQIDIEIKRSKADYVIENNSDYDELKEKYSYFLKFLPELNSRPHKKLLSI
ncbi:MAG: dephospho-CoA kinase [Candidatus Zophobacter franzmannii]|nr:dephospho-CoA kinase [Candidatus Zophobacter franzmannii]